MYKTKQSHTGEHRPWEGIQLGWNGLRQFTSRETLKRNFSSNTAKYLENIHINNDWHNVLAFVQTMQPIKLRKQKGKKPLRLSQRNPQTDVSHLKWIQLLGLIQPTNLSTVISGFGDRPLAMRLCRFWLATHANRFYDNFWDSLHVWENELSSDRATCWA